MWIYVIVIRLYAKYESYISMNWLNNVHYQNRQMIKITKDNYFYLSIKIISLLNTPEITINIHYYNLNTFIYLTIIYMKIFSMQAMIKCYVMHESQYQT